MKKNYSHTASRPPHTLEDSLAEIFRLLDDTPLPHKPSELTSSRLQQNLLFTIKRHQASLIWLIDKRAQGKVRPRTRKVLFWALAELLFLDGAPEHAIVDTATHYVKKHHALPEAGFVNAFLRSITDDIDHSRDLLADAPQPVRLELPELLWNRWLDAYGETATTAFAETLLLPSPILLRAPLWPDYHEQLPSCFTPVNAPDWFPQAHFYTLSEHRNLSELLSQFPQFYIQDPATLLAPAMTTPQPGETVADLCAAPGGKSRILAELMHDSGRLICRDKLPAKLDIIRQNLRAFHCQDIAADDATAPQLPPASLDAILLDVPCTNTGVLRHKPDAKWSFTTTKLKELTELQRRILDAAVPLLKPNGRLVYSTCSLEPEENILQINAFLADHPDFSLEQHRQLLPSTEHDGAFAARLIKHVTP